KTWFQMESNVRKIAGGTFQTLIIKNDGNLYGTGWNTSGQLGTGDDQNRSSFELVFRGAKAVVCGGSHSLVLATDGKLWATGANDMGQLGIGDRSTFFIYNWTPAPIQGVSAIACGFDHSLALKSGGTLWVTGSAAGLGTGERYDLYGFERKIALRSYKNGMYVCADLNYGWDGPLYSNRSVIGPWETFGLIDLGSDEVALRAYANDSYVSAADGGASRVAASSWWTVAERETFHLYYISGNFSYLYALRAKINDNYLRYDSFIPEQANWGSDTLFYVIDEW
ncbi:MAG: hypothetical protein EHM28_06140, partial [Spirochaetaceae bacterium]